MNSKIIVVNSCMKRVKLIIVFITITTILNVVYGIDVRGVIIRGCVKDKNGMPLPYANVFLKDSFEGTITDSTGNFSFVTRRIGTQTLICSYIGYKRFIKNIDLTGAKRINISIIMELEPVEISPITITASAFTTSDEEGVILNSLEVVKTPGAAADVFWAIKSFPGLQQVEEGAGLFVRGGDVSETAIYLDGALINHPYKYESPTGGFFGTFNPFLLKGTFFSSGGFSARYGNALSGILSMESQNLPERLQIGVGIGLAAESVLISMPVVKDKLGVNLSGNLSNTKMMFYLNGCRKNFSHYPSSYDFNLNCVYKFNSYTRLKFFIFREDDRVGLEVDDPDYSTFFYGDGSNRFYNIQFSTMIGRKFVLKTNSALNDFIRNVKLGTMKLKMTDRLYQARMSVEGEFIGGMTLHTGIDLFRFSTLINGTVPLEKGDVNPDAPSIKVDTDYCSNRVAHFTEFELLTPLGIKFIPGFRFEYESISKSFRTDPRLSMVLALSEHASLNFAWGRYHQDPAPEYFDPYIGNPNLRAMESIHYIVGLFYKKGNMIFRLEGYSKRYKNLLLKDEEINYTNKGYGSAKGIDIFIKNRLGPISGWISYSWLRARRKWMDIPVMAPPYFDITHNLTSVLSVDLFSNLSFGTSLRYATGKPYTPAKGEYNTARVPDYIKLDITLSYLCTIFRSNMTVFYVAVSNLLGRINIFDYRYSDDYKRREAVESSFARSVYFGFSTNIL